MRTLFIIPLILMILLPFPSWGADYDKGFEAATRGDFATALREFTPIAEEGNPGSIIWGLCTIMVMG